jgi:methionyl-tRNA formyltransferase
MKKSHQIFINIHPSLLPDLKGKHPINGAILFDRKHGVTCHHMDDGIDTGSVIANIEIPITDDLDLGLLYQLSFIAEGEVFEKAHSLKFEANELRCTTVTDPIYYTRRNIRLGDNYSR